MEYSPAVDKGGRATVPMTTPSPAMESLPAVRSFTTPLEHTTASGSSRQNEEYSGNQHLGTPTTRPFNWRDVYPVDQNAHAFANQDYTLLAGRHTDPLQSTSRFSSFTPDSTRSQPNSQSPIRFTGHQADPAASQVTNETNHYNLLNSPVREPKSVKHLTCFYWRTYGKCNKTEEQCLYAHHNTGQLADEPKHLEPGRPAVAGRNARSKIPNYPARRKGPDGSYQQSPPRFSATLQGGAIPYNHTYGPGTAFQLGHVPDNMTLLRNSPPNSAIAQRFLNMTLNQSDSHVTKTFHDKQIQTMRDIIELQAHMAKASRERLLALSKQIKYCREKLKESTATLSAMDKVQAHVDTVGALVKEYATVEREADAMAEQLKVLEVEVNKEMVAGGFVSSGTAS